MVWTDLAPGMETTLKVASTESGYVGRHPELLVLLQDTVIDSGSSCASHLFQCLDGSCLDQDIICNFVKDCLHGDDEEACGIKCDFEEPCLWDAPPVSSQIPGWQVHSGSTETSGTGPSGGYHSDSGSDLEGRYLYVNASNQDIGTPSYFVSSRYSESGPQCRFHFQYHMYGSNAGNLRVILNRADSNATIWEVTGSQDNQWLGDVLHLGRQREPFRIIFEAVRGGGGDLGDVALDSLEFSDCSPDALREQCPKTYFVCDNLACVGPDKVCDLHLDCLLGEEETSQQCGVIPFGGACSFEDGWCAWQNVLQQDHFDWTRNNGSTPTSKTGPSIDHTLGNDRGHYVYTEVSGAESGHTAFLRSVWFQPPPAETYDRTSQHYETCKVRFSYHMYGSGTGQLKLYAIQNGSSHTGISQLFSQSGDQGDMWMTDVASLPAITESYYLQFESTRGWRYTGDIALDDISLSPQCFQLLDLTLDTTTPDPATTITMTEPLSSQSIESVSNLPTPVSSNQTVFHFSTCGALEDQGPTQSQCDVAYSFENISVRVEEGIQKWIVPSNKTYSLKLEGAGGGTGVENTSPSHGAEIQASFNLSAGDLLFILVGQKGEDACDDAGSPQFGASAVCTNDLTDATRQQFGVGGYLAGGGGGGGGGTFVAKLDVSSGEYIPLLIAGGGGGLSFSPSQTLGDIHGSIDAPGTGQPGIQGSSIDVSGSGGGWNGTSLNITQASGMSFLQGGMGGSGCALAHLDADWRIQGGFGGGGGGCTSGGGGGGYTGGNAPLFKDLTGSGQGGTSYVHPTGFNVQRKSGKNTGSGSVIIKAILSCPANEILTDDGTSCVYLPENGLPVAVIVGSILPVLIILICIMVFMAISYQRKKKELAGTVRGTDTVDYQLNQLRHNASSDFNPCYQLGDGAVTVKDLMELPRENLKLIGALGQGAFGEVYHGQFQPPDEKEPYEVAVKTLPERCTSQDETDFLMEALIMGNFRHPNIVSLKGVCFTQAPRFILLEYMAGGELRQFLRDSRPRKGQPSVLDMSDLLLIAHDVSRGCEYLESRHFIHRDIAARNVLLSSRERGRSAKIGDFGMARDIYRADYYRKDGLALLPVKWMPPEAFLDGIFTSKTDVWSFGVLLWEIMSLGYMPYPGMSNQEVIHFVTAGRRMNSPAQCPRPIHDLMALCWQQDPDNRPLFASIMQNIASSLQDVSVLNTPLPQDLFEEETNPAVMRPRDPKRSPVLKVNQSYRQPSWGDTNGRKRGVSASDGEEFLNPDWMSAGSMKDHLLLDNNNVNNSADCLGACGTTLTYHPNDRKLNQNDAERGGEACNESVNKLKKRRRDRTEEMRGSRPNSDTSFTPPINISELATEGSDLLDRENESEEEEEVSCHPPSKSSTPRNTFSPTSQHRLAKQSAIDSSPQGSINNDQSPCCSDRADVPRLDLNRESPVPNGNATGGTDAHSASLSPRILNRFRLPVFSRHSSLEASPSTHSSPPLPMLNRMQSLPVRPNPYTMTDLNGLTTPDDTRSSHADSNSLQDAANRRVMFSSESGHVMFEGDERNGSVV
ncbi:ALK tyrosine kinase receptor-like [Asterias rubens]|uniref:ALK tyrosine kinase receptor-like n=1 Tax=Asterias rubens TaxID=7604 RepID=UPI001454E57B|nr:ALK tyrosine kinase receptor-like [Asterias rubens]